MNRILFIFILVCISSKASIVYRDNKIISSENTAIKQGKDSIIGTWNISRSISTKVKYKNGIKTKIESAFVYNACPIIVFKEDGTGVLINAVGNKSSFFWLINKEKMCFSFNEKKDENSFFTPEKGFVFKVYHDSKNCFLELIHLKYNFKYILIR